MAVRSSFVSGEICPGDWAKVRISTAAVTTTTSAARAARPSEVLSPYSTRLSTDDAGSPACSGGLLSCCTISVTPKMAAAPNSRPTTMLAAAGTMNRSIGQR